jgi:glycosyltransferase involved in cell wall biosynthesis
MEAAATGVPVIATDIRGCRQVVDDGVSGILFPVGDVSALIAAIERIGSDPALRESMGRASKERAAQHFNEDKVVEIVMETYRDAARRKGLGWPGSG